MASQGMVRDVMCVQRSIQVANAMHHQNMELIYLPDGSIIPIEMVNGTNGTQLNEPVKDLKRHFDSIVFVSYLTVQPDRETVNDYVLEMKKELEDETTQIWYIGRMAAYIDTRNLSENMSVFSSIESLVKSV